jgi:hypothetical protein
MPNRIQFEPQTRTGPCLNNCGQTATYELVDPETERQQATCPSCGVYEASKDEMEDACDAD